jgi:TPR repeat protein
VHQQAFSSLGFLAEKGYVEAQGQLASIYARDPSPFAREQAARWFQEVNRHTDRYQTRYIRWLASYAEQEPSLFQEALTLLEQQMQNEGDVGPELVRLLDAAEQLTDEKVAAVLSLIHGANAKEDKIRVLAQLDDLSPFLTEFEGLCEDSLAQRYECLMARLRYAKEHQSDSLEDIVTEANAAYKKSQIDDAQLLRLMSQLLTTEGGTVASYPQFARQLVESAIGSSDVLFLRFAQLDEAYTSGKQAMLSRLESLHTGGNVQASTILGNLYIDGKQVITQPRIGEAYLLAAIDSADAKLSLGRLYLSGRLGIVKLQEGVDLLVDSGRQGNPQAYKELMRVFSGSRGVQPDNLYSHTFAQVFQSFGYAVSERDVSKLKNLVLSEEQERRVNKMVKAELASVSFEAQ